MAEGERIYQLTLAERNRIDVVPYAALIFGAVSFIMPFAALKENRVVDGELISGAQIAGPVISVLAIIVFLAVIVAAASPRLFRGSDGGSRYIYRGLERARPYIYLSAAGLSLWICAALLARAGGMMSGGAAPRVSPALGFWGLPICSYVLVDHAKPEAGRGRYLALALFLVIPAVVILAGGRGESVSVVREFSARRGRFLDEALVHLRLFSMAVAIAGLIGIPLGILASNRKRMAGPLIAFVDGAQTIPSMALFGLLMAPLAALSRAVPVLRTLGIKGIGAAPALIALSLYAMLPIVRNTIAGLAAVPDASIEAGRGMGMSTKQLFRKIRWPMALPYVLAGLRTASVQAVGNTAVAALIGAGGLGIMIFQGLGQAAPDLILLGVIPLILLAVGVDRLWGWLIGRWVSPGLRTEGGI